jgi:hypothetical protein
MISDVCPARSQCLALQLAEVRLSSHTCCKTFCYGLADDQKVFLRRSRDLKLKSKCSCQIFITSFGKELTAAKIKQLQSKNCNPVELPISTKINDCLPQVTIL